MSTGGGFGAMPQPMNGQRPPPPSLEREMPPELPLEEAPPPALGDLDQGQGPAPPDRQNAQRLIRWADPTQSPNIAREILDDKASFPDGESILGKIGQRVVREYEIDVESRSNWMDRTRAAMDFAMLVARTKTSPWPGSSNIVYPLIATGAIQFAARAYPAIINGADVVKGRAHGSDDGLPMVDEAGQPIIDPNTGVPAIAPPPAPQPGDKRKRADRMAEHMSWQLLEEQPEWHPDTDTLLHVLPIVGCHFRKSLFDASLGRNLIVGVFAKHLVINYRAKSMELAPRITEELKLYPVEIMEEERAGTFLHHEYGLAEGAATGDEDAPHDFLEQHRRWDIDGDGYPEPYIVTVHKQTMKVVRIVARWDPEGVKYSAITNAIRKIEPVHYYTKYDFLPNPDGGIYGMGFGQLLNPINEGINTTLNMMFDAGHLQNTGGGFIGKGLGMHTGAVRFKLGEWKVVNALGSTVRDSVVPLTFPGPSATLFQLLGLLIDAGKEIASNTEVLSGNQTRANVPATTTLALIEQGLKVFTAVYKRIYRALASEFDKQKRLNRLYLDRQTSYRRGDEWKTISQADYMEGAGVEPISDPSMVSEMQELARAEFLKEFINDPLVDGVEIRRRMFKAAHIQDIDLLLKPNQPVDPMAEKAVQLKEIEVKSNSIKNLALAAKALADADVAISEDFRGWATLQLDALKARMEALGEPEEQPAPPAGANGGGGAPVPAMAPPPGNGAVPPLPA